MNPPHHFRPTLSAEQLAAIENLHARFVRLPERRTPRRFTHRLGEVLMLAFSDNDAFTDIEATGKGPKAKGGRPSLNPFSGIARCGGCDQSMEATGDGSAYRCPKCALKILTDDLEAAFLDDLAEVLEERGGMRLIEAAEAETETRLADCEAEIRRLESDVEANQRLYSAGNISIERFGETHQPLDNRLTELKAERLKLIRRTKS